jgi:hypothetical protein
MLERAALPACVLPAAVRQEMAAANGSTLHSSATLPTAGHTLCHLLVLVFMVVQVLVELSLNAVHPM